MKIYGFGEILLRMHPFVPLSLRQSFLNNVLQVNFAGSEHNVLGFLAYNGYQTSIISALPKNEVGDISIHYLNGLNIKSNLIDFVDASRIGIFYSEKGNQVKASNVVYDRAGSAFAQYELSTSRSTQIIQEITDNPSWFHTSGITPAVSKNKKDMLMNILKELKGAKPNTITSFDCNFRGKLWDWDGSKTKYELAKETYMEVLPFMDVFVGGHKDISDILSLPVPLNDKKEVYYLDLCKALSAKFKNLKVIALSCREVHTSLSNTYGAFIYVPNEDIFIHSKDIQGNYAGYRVDDIVDRIGGGDAFTAGLIHSLVVKNFTKAPITKNQWQEILDFSVYASVFSHYQNGDVSYTKVSEIDSFVKNSSATDVSR